MRGIDSEGLDTIKNRIADFQENVSDDMEISSKQLQKVTTTFSGVDLLFLTDKIKEEINQFERIKHNNDNYSMILLEVIKSYHSQNDTLREILNSVTPR